jgi:hypothetical protein
MAQGDDPRLFADRRLIPTAVLARAPLRSSASSTMSQFLTQLCSTEWVLTTTSTKLCRPASLFLASEGLAEILPTAYVDYAAPRFIYSAQFRSLIGLKQTLELLTAIALLSRWSLLPDFSASLTQVGPDSLRPLVTPLFSGSSPAAPL